MLDKFASINWLAVLVAGFAMFMIGGVWYGVIFAKLWQRLHGYTDEQVKAMQKARPPQIFFGVMLFSYLVGCFVLAFLIVNLDLRGPFNGAVLGAFLWLFCTTVLGLTDHITRTRPFAAYILDSSFQLVSFIAAGIIIASWR